MLLMIEIFWKTPNSTYNRIYTYNREERVFATEVSIYVDAHYTMKSIFGNL